MTCGEFLGMGIGGRAMCQKCSGTGSVVKAARDSATGKVQCPVCEKWVSEAGLSEHMGAKHPGFVLQFNQKKV